MPERLRVAVVGGSIAVSHIAAYKNLSALFDLVAICDSDQDKAHRIATEHAIPSVTIALADLCRMDDVDVIDLCTPPLGGSLHHPSRMQHMPSLSVTSPQLAGSVCG